ncbi:hypothetical protein RP20_CCG012170 [Aedes albopictus]|nr:hypothetical protein RP20_CCG012170 [Aedes albopictus]
MTPEDITYMRGAMKQNLVVLLADLFNLFEIHPAKCVCYPGMEQQQVAGIPSRICPGNHSIIPPRNPLENPTAIPLEIPARILLGLLESLRGFFLEFLRGHVDFYLKHDSFYEIAKNCQKVISNLKTLKEKRLRGFGHQIIKSEPLCATNNDRSIMFNSFTKLQNRAVAKTAKIATLALAGWLASALIFST